MQSSAADRLNPPAVAVLRLAELDARKRSFNVEDQRTAKPSGAAQGWAACRGAHFRTSLPHLTQPLGVGVVLSVKEDRFEPLISGQRSSKFAQNLIARNMDFEKVLVALGFDLVRNAEIVSQANRNRLRVRRPRALGHHAQRIVQRLQIGDQGGLN